MKEQIRCFEFSVHEYMSDFRRLISFPRPNSVSHWCACENIYARAEGIVNFSYRLCIIDDDKRFETFQELTKLYKEAVDIGYKLQ